MHRIFAPGLALDLTVPDPLDQMPWDFRLKSKRERARQLLKEQCPLLLIGSPDCRAYSVWQRLNENMSSNPDKYRRARIEAEIHMRFVTSLYADQVDRGCYFLHEHPAGATSWSLECVQNLLRMKSVGTTIGDQCQYGAQVNHGTQRKTNTKAYQIYVELAGFIGIPIQTMSGARWLVFARWWR